MFTLRRYSSNRVQMNAIIGDQYTLIDKERNFEAFCETFQNVFKEKYNPDLKNSPSETVYAFIVHFDFCQPLYMGQEAYVMIDGKTHDNVSFR